jgi:glycosyltransferase involved in cell wall biosynthesis
MRVLFISRHFPKNLQTDIHGGFKRIRMFIDVLKEIAQLDMLFYVPPHIDVSPSSVSELERLLSEHWNAEISLFLCPRFDYAGHISKRKLYAAGAFSLFRQLGYVDTCGPQHVQALEACLSRRPDMVFVHRLGSMCPLLLTREKLPCVFFDLDDIEHIAFIRNTGQLPKWYARLLYYTHLPALWWGEYKAIRLAHRTFVCSELDRFYLANRWRLPRVVTVPNAVTIPELQPLTPEPTLLFIGSYSYKPNVDAADFLIERVWPRVYRAMPTARLIVAGTPSNRIRGYGLDIPGVEFTGFVEDLDGLYGRSRVVCAPILSGGGTRVKIIEAAAYGKPIVSTRLGAEGLEMRDGDELLLRDDPESFAEACLKLLEDVTLCNQLGSAARARTVQCYERMRVVRLIQKHFTEWATAHTTPQAVSSRIGDLG